MGFFFLSFFIHSSHFLHEPTSISTAGFHPANIQKPFRVFWFDPLERKNVKQEAVKFDPEVRAVV